MRRILGWLLLRDRPITYQVASGENARDGAFQGPLAIAGDSAGANLALASMLREMEADRRLPDFQGR